MQISKENIMKVAEQYLLDELSAADRQAIEQQLQGDGSIRNDWREATYILKTLAGAKEQQQFRNKSAAALAAFKKTDPKPLQIASLPTWRRYLRIASVAASFALLGSLITYSLATSNSNTKSDNNFVMLKREIQNLKQNQAILNKSIESEGANAIKQYAGDEAGTGFAISNNGYLATNYHVVNGADSIFIQTAAGKYYRAFIVAFEPKNDIAILKIEDNDFRFSEKGLPFGISKKSGVLSQHIYSLGFPQDNTLYTEGYISSSKGYQGDEDSYQLEMNANPGQSGAPVFDANGTVIGIVTGKQTFATYATKSSLLYDFVKTMPKDLKINLAEPSAPVASRTDQVARAVDFVFAVRVYK